MTNKINFQITIPRNTKYLQLIGNICEKISNEVYMPQGVRVSVFNTINAVLTESIVNTIKHNPKDIPNNFVYINIILTDYELNIKVYDRGQGFNLNEVPEINFNSDQLQESGRGIMIIRELMDYVIYNKTDEVNILEMRKRLLK